MSASEPTNLIRVQVTYTFDEAIEYMKMKDKQTTKTGESVRWVDAKTGKHVAIGYTS